MENILKSIGLVILLLMSTNHAVFAKSIHVLDVAKWDEGYFGEGGSLSGKGIIKLLRDDGFLPDRLFDPIKKSIPKENSLQVFEAPRKNDNKIYRVKVNQGPQGVKSSGDSEFVQKFVIKYFKGPEENEAEHLERVNDSPLSRLPYGNHDLPVLALVEKNYCYFYQRLEHCVSILHSARGRPVHDFLLQAVEQGQGKELELAKKAFFRAGKALAGIHLRFAEAGSLLALEALALHAPEVPRNQPSKKESAILSQMKTYIHGDAHTENIFYHPKEDRIYLIDNEYFAESVRAPDHPSIDIQAFAGWASSVERGEGGKKNIPILKELMSRFVEGYRSAFPLGVQPALTEELWTMIEDAKIHNPFESWLGQNKIL